VRYYALDVLACPYCHAFPLKLVVLEERRSPMKYPWPSKPFCDYVCAFRGVEVAKCESCECEECFSREVVSGVLVCQKCGRWFAVVEGVPQLLPDEARDFDAERALLSRFREKLERLDPEVARCVFGEASHVGGTGQAPGRV